MLPNRKPMTMTNTTSEAGGERPEKYLAALGLASRREIARWIEAGRLAANGHTLRGGQRIGARDRLTLDGKPLRVPRAAVEHRVVLYHKPVGEIVTRHDPEGRPSVFEVLPPLSGGRWVVVGRLDVTTTGLLLFTTDGALAARLMHPRHEMTRTYMVRVHGEVPEDLAERMTRGIELDDGTARFDSCVALGRAGNTNRWYKVSLREGRNREVRRMFESLNLQVSGLKRIGYGPVALPRDLRPGQWLELDSEGIEELEAAVHPDGEPIANPQVKTTNERSTNGQGRNNIRR